ncbi:MAG: ABC transporter ATP-binding protein [candidate division Zixibacteria bacterium]
MIAQLSLWYHFYVLAIKVESLKKNFGERKVISSLNLEIRQGESVAITGPNGSGKTTLLKLLLALLRPSSGKVTYFDNDRVISQAELRHRISFVSPYLSLYDQLSAEENLQFFTAVRGGNITGKEIDSLLHRVGLEGRGMDLVSDYSTGMKQRLKYAVALSNKPDFLLIDEPSSGLDDSGKAMMIALIEEQRSGSIIIIATNEKEEYSLASKQCRLDQ